MKKEQRAALPCAVLALVLGLATSAKAQSYGAPAPPAGHEHAAQATAAGGKAEMSATLVDAEKKAMQQSATVTATVKGVAMTDPAQVAEKPRPGQGHLHYQVDDGPVIATTATKLSFHGLKPGSHKIVVTLAANDHTPLGPQQTLTVTVPAKTGMN